MSVVYRTSNPSPDADGTHQGNALSTWNANIYLYEGARQRNVMMMLHALALGADKNFVNEHDQGRTPLIQTILSVSHSKFVDTTNDLSLFRF